MPQILRLFAVGLASLLLVGCATPPRTVRILSYNIHHGEGTDGRLDLERIARVIHATSPDLVALQEVDHVTRRTRGVDQCSELGRLTGLHAVFGRSMDYSGGGYGNAILSRWPMVDHVTHPLPSSAGREPRSALAVRVNPHHLPALTFISTHLDHTRDATDRIAQTARLNELFLADDGETVILAGDLNASDDKDEIQTLLRHWADGAAKNVQPTIPSDNPRARIDYILYRPVGDWIVVESRVIDEPVASDHRPVLVVLQQSQSPVTGKPRSQY